MRNYATCHPDRYVLANGLCSQCYERERARTRKNKWSENDKGKRATCHPEKRNYSKGLCRACHQKKFKEDNPEKKKVYYQQIRDNWIRYSLYSRFRMTVEQYDAKLQEQNGVCAICRKQDTKGRRLSVDHNHATNEIRGLLCQKCNTVIGMCLEDKNTLKAAIEYLKLYES